MDKFRFAERLQASKDKTFCNPEARQQILRELCDMRLSDIFPDYYKVLFETVTDDVKRREVFAELTYGDIAECAVKRYRDNDPLSVGRLIDALTLPIRESMRIEQDISNHRVKMRAYCRSRFDVRFWNDILFQLDDVKKARGFYYYRMFTFEEYFDTLLEMTDNDERIVKVRQNYIIEYNPNFDPDEDEDQEEMLFCIDDPMKGLWWKLFDNENHRRSYQLAYELLAIPIAVLNKRLHNNDNQRSDNND